MQFWVVARVLLGVQSDCNGIILSSCGSVLISCQGVAMSFLRCTKSVLLLEL